MVVNSSAVVGSVIHSKQLYEQVIVWRKFFLFLGISFMMSTTRSQNSGFVEFFVVLLSSLFLSGFHSFYSRVVSRLQRQKEASPLYSALQ